MRGERWIYTIPLRLKSLFRRRRVDAELDEELRDHVERKTEEYLRKGLARGEARCQALLEMGGIEKRKEECRDQRGVHLVEGAMRDLRYAWRTLWRSPGFTIVAALTLALGIGANTAIYSIVHATLVAPFPYPHPEQLVVVWSMLGGNRNGVSPADYLDWKRESKAIHVLGAVRDSMFNLSVGDRPEEIEGSYATIGFMDQLIGDQPFMGRYFLPGEDVAGRDHVVVITHKLWQDHFASDPEIIGKQIHINNELYTVIGIQRPGQPDRLARQLVVPMVFGPEEPSRDIRSVVVLGRLKPGVTVAQAQAEMNNVSGRLAQMYPKADKGWDVSVEPLKNDFLPRQIQVALLLLMGAVCFVLLIACVNVANLLLARGATRQREVAVRVSVGASSGHIFRQFLIESLALAGVGAALGTGLAWAPLQTILAMMPPFTLLSEDDPRMNVPVLLFTLGTAVLAGIVFGCAPAWQATRLDLNEVLKKGARSGFGNRHTALRRALVVAEFALALSLLAGGGLAIHSVWNLARVDVGFRTDHLLTFYLPNPQGAVNADEGVNGFYEPFLERIQALPGVTAASMSIGMPPGNQGADLPFQIAGKPVMENASARPSANFNIVTAGFFRVFDVQMELGRALNDQDVAGGSRVAVVNESFAKKYLAGVDPLTQRILVPRLIPGAFRTGAPIEWRVVGIYRDLHNGGLGHNVLPEIDVPFAQSPWPDAAVAVRANVDPNSLTNSIGRVIQELDSRRAMAFTRTMDETLREWTADDRFQAMLLGGFAAIALALAALGIYGVMSFTVAQRTREIGLRVALGASRRRVIGFVLKEGMILALTGLFLGLAGAYAIGREMRGFWFGVSAFDVPVVSAIAAMLLFSAFLACYVPACRAARVDPMQALREE